LNRPFFTILTPTYNRAGLLGRALQSVQDQQGVTWEHLVLDGGSQDATAEVVAQFPGTHFFSAPDRGLYDAINKGLRMARGEFVGLLNSDDVYTAGALAEVARVAGEADMVSGGAEIVTPDGCCLRTVSRPDETALTVQNVLSGTPLINARFFRRTWLERVGEFDLHFPVAADREWLLRVCLARPREKGVERVVYRYLQHEGSLTFNTGQAAYLRCCEEHVAIAEKHLRAGVFAPEVLRALKRFHTRESVTAAGLLWRQRRLEPVLEMARRGLAQTRFWPLAFGKRIAGQWLGR
jgi:glycosyltransferase involved in cell wall biosynthesis